MKAESSDPVDALLGDALLARRELPEPRTTTAARLRAGYRAAAGVPNRFDADLAEARERLAAEGRPVSTPVPRTQADEGRATGVTPMTWFRLDVAFLRREDFLDLSLVQQALLMRLRAYAAEQGTLPANLGGIVRRFGGKPKDVAPLERWFPLLEDGSARWDPELELDRARLADIKSKRSAAGKASAEARGRNAEQGARETVQGRPETVQGPSKLENRLRKHNDPGAPVEQVLGAESSTTTSYAPSKSEAGTREVEQVFNHSVHTVHTLHSVPSPPAVPPEHAGQDQTGQGAGGRGPSGAKAAPARWDRERESAHEFMERVARQRKNAPRITE